MAYENVRLKKGKEKIVIVDDCEMIVKRVTIDYKTGNYMFKKSVNRNSPEHARFEMVIGEVVVDLWFYKHFEDDPNTMIWTLEKYFINGPVKKKDLFVEIKKAIEAYGCSGYTVEEKNFYIEKYGVDNNGFGKLDLGRIQ